MRGSIHLIVIIKWVCSFLKGNVWYHSFIYIFFQFRTFAHEKTNSFLEQIVIVLCVFMHNISYVIKWSYSISVFETGKCVAFFRILYVDPFITDNFIDVTPETRIHEINRMKIRALWLSVAEIIRNQATT